MPRGTETNGHFKGRTMDTCSFGGSGGGQSGGGRTESSDGGRGIWGGATSQTCGLAHYDQDPTKILVQTGRQVAVNVASAIARVTKPTWGKSVL